MSAATIIFPKQLFKANPAVAAGRKVYLVKGYLFSENTGFISKKILFHRATMQAHATYLLAKNIAGNTLKQQAFA